MEDTRTDVQQDSSPVVSEDLKTQTQLPDAPVVTSTSPATQPKGSQTPSENLYAALAEERRLRKEAEDKLNNLTTTSPSDDVYSDEGRLLKKQLEEQNERINQLLEERELEKTLATNPLLKEKLAEFQEFRKDYPRHKLENVAKIFLAEHGLLEPQRKGLEKPSGGVRTAQASGMTAEEVEHLRKTDYKKYKEMLMADQIKLQP